MKKSLSIVTLIAAGAACAMADISTKLDGYEYSDAPGGYVDHNQASQKGYNSFSGVKNTYWNGKSVNLAEDARYTISFNVLSSTGSADSGQPLFNFYLAAEDNSILFGNYYDVGNYERGAAGIFHATGNVAQGDTAQFSNTYALNSYLDGVRNGGIAYWKRSDKVTSLGAQTNLANGYHTYTIIVESFASETEVDKIIFSYNGVNGSGNSQEFALSSEAFGIILPNKDLQIGWFTSNEGGSMLLEQATYKKELRVSAIPEPSAFGLLAGLGTLCLVGARRRRR